MNKVLLPAVTVTDNVGIHLFTTSRPNGSEFTWGEHNVTYTASDKAGNTAKCEFQVIITGYTCPNIPAPLNGAKACETWLTGMFCTVHCNEGFGFAIKPHPVYFCTPDGTWKNAKVPGKKTPSFPDCSKTHKPKKALVNGDLHYLAKQCSGANMNEVIASNFIELFRNSPFGMAGGCNGQCTIDNVRVVCGDETEARRKRDAADDKQTSKIPLTVYFTLKVPLPTNDSLNNLNQTTLQISNSMIEALNDTDLNQNISGVVMEYDTSKPPVFRFVGLLCDKGQVLRGTTCVNCPVGYFFDIAGCQACPVDQYQDKEAQTSCVSCPSKTTTSGQTASRWHQNCKGISSLPKTEKQGISKPILYSAIAGSLVFVVLIGVTIFCVRKKHFPFHRDRQTPPRTEDMGCSNQTYLGTESLGFENLNYLLQDAAIGSSEQDYERLCFSQSEV
ncbi:hypothetical protein ACROYT_G033872 [Oculina patagonica]